MIPLRLPGAEVAALPALGLYERGFRDADRPCEPLQLQPLCHGPRDTRRHGTTQLRSRCTLRLEAGWGGSPAEDRQISRFPPPPVRFP
jgi:hypothetical protein